LLPHAASASSAAATTTALRTRERDREGVVGVRGPVVGVELAIVEGVEVAAGDLDKEREILMEQLKNDPKNAGKPEDVLNKIIEGRLNKFYEENVLVDQPFVKDPSKTVGELVAEKIGSIKENISIRRFTRYKMGEGIEKKADDFAAEVASMVG
jgi:elongation factor Ts